MLSAKELDEQCQINLESWIELDSQRWRDLDDDPSFTKRVLKVALEEPAFLYFDIQGRLWGKGNEGNYFPFHIETSNGKKYGIRVSKKAAN